MRRSFVFLIVGLMIFSALPVSAAATPESFVGSWTAYDPAPPDGDGSFMVLTIWTQGPRIKVHLFDTWATAACDPAAPVALRGSGVIRGDELRVSFSSVNCSGATPTISGAAFGFTAMPDGTLIDSSGIVWSRA